MIKALRWCFADRTTGRIAVAQMPNFTLWVFIISFAAGFIFARDAPIAAAMTVVAAVSLTIWALDEIFRGVNPWRRVFGAAILAYQAVHFL